MSGSSTSPFTLHHDYLRRISNRCCRSVQTGEKIPIPAGQPWSEELVVGRSASLKIAKTAELIDARAITQFEYTITNTLWYDISLIDCANNAGAPGANGLPSVDGSQCPGFEGGIRLEATGGQCALANLPPSTYDPAVAYFVPEDNLSTKSCLDGQAGGDITMTLCTGGPAKRGIAGRIEY